MKKETETSINNLVRRRTRSVSLIATFIEWKMKERRKIVWFCSTENFGCNKFLVIYHFCEALACYWKTFCQKQQFFITIMKAWCMMPLLINELVSCGAKGLKSFCLFNNRFAIDCFNQRKIFQYFHSVFITILKYLCSLCGNKKSIKAQIFTNWVENSLCDYNRCSQTEINNKILPFQTSKQTKTSLIDSHSNKKRNNIFKGNASERNLFI